MEITQERVKELFDYHPDGYLIRKITQGTSKKGKVVNSLDGNGYFATKINGKTYSVHRLVYLIHYGKFPKNQLDHIDRCKTNNKIENLRDATISQNKMNITKLTKNTSGYKGVNWHSIGNKWLAQIMVNRKKYILGCSQTKKMRLKHTIVPQKSILVSLHTLTFLPLNLVCE